jgi:Ca2+-binding EF-hand superfamily protein
MRLTQSLFFLVAAALSLAVGAAYAAEDKIGRDANDPGFNNLDKNHDGYLSRSEAAGNPELAKRFKQADRNGDGKLSRAEYLETMTAQDARTAKKKAARAIDRSKEPKAGTGSTTERK